MTRLVVTGSHPLMQKIRSLASRLATCDTPALILGEDGTGKRDLALHIHQQSKRATGPFVTIDGADLSLQDLPDLVQETNGGTLFLANVDCCANHLQRLLAPVLDRGELVLPDSRTIRSNIRLIASAEPDLAPGTPCDDLLTRLGRVSLCLPPLRERRSDIPAMVTHLLDRFASEHEGPVRRLADDALVLLWQYDWPGNLRELMTVMRESAATATDGVIRTNVLPAQIRWLLKRNPNERDSAEAGYFHSTENDDRDPSVLH